MMNRQLSMAWEKWQEWYAEIKDQQRLMGGALTRFMQRQLSMAWEKWQDWYAQHMYEMRLLGGAANRLRNFHLSKAWEQVPCVVAWSRSFGP